MEIEFARTTTAAELLLPDNFARQRARMRQELAPIFDALTEITTLSTTEDYNQAVALGRVLQAAQKQFEELYKPIKQGIDERKKQVLDMAHLDVDPIEDAKNLLGHLVDDYQQREKAERKLQEARELEASLARAETDMPLPMPVIAQAPPKMKGKVERSLWKAHVDSLAMLVEAVARGEVPLIAVVANEPWLNKRADADHEAMKIPGVSAHEQRKVHFRA